MQITSAKKRYCMKVINQLCNMLRHDFEELKGRNPEFTQPRAILGLFMMVHLKLGNRQIAELLEIGKNQVPNLLRKLGEKDRHMVSCFYIEKNEVKFNESAMMSKDKMKLIILFGRTSKRSHTSIMSQLPLPAPKYYELVREAFELDYANNYHI